MHRNIANLIVHTDLNCLSVIQDAMDVLKVRHVMVVGHYGCGGVQAALRGQRVGLADYWLRHLEDLRHIHGRRVALEPFEADQVNHLTRSSPKGKAFHCKVPSSAVASHSRHWCRR